MNKHEVRTDTGNPKPTGMCEAMINSGNVVRAESTRPRNVTDTVHRLALALALAATPLAASRSSFGQQAAPQSGTQYSVALVDVLPNEAERGAVLLTRYADETRAEPGLVGLDPILFTLRFGWRRRHRSTSSAVGCAGAADSRSSCA